MLWNDAYLAEHGHIVGIAIPAWHYMHVEMLSDTGSGGCTKIETDVQTVRPHSLTEHLLAEHGEFAKLGPLGGFQGRE